MIKGNARKIGRKKKSVYHYDNWEGAANVLRRIFIPEYDETLLYTMSFAFIFLYSFNPLMRAQIHHFIFDPAEFRLIVFFLIFVLGLALTLFHALTKYKKTSTEKIAMLFFAVILNATSGIVAGNFLLDNFSGWLVVFPLWNLANAMILLIFYRFRIFTAKSMQERDATIPEVIISSVIVVLLLNVLMHKGMYWAIAFSISIFYASTFNTVILKAYRRIFSDDKVKKR